MKTSFAYSATDDFGFNAVQDPVHVRDLHATILHFMGIDRTLFTVLAQGLDPKLTGVEGSSVIKKLIA